MSTRCLDRFVQRTDRDSSCALVDVDKASQQSSDFTLRSKLASIAVSMTNNVHERQQVSPVQSTFAGLAAFVSGTQFCKVQARGSVRYCPRQPFAAIAAGAAIAGGAHYVTTAKRLAEEGIDPTQRVKAMPVAVSSCELLKRCQPFFPAILVAVSLTSIRSH